MADPTIKLTMAEASVVLSNLRELYQIDTRTGFVYEGDELSYPAQYNTEVQSVSRTENSGRYKFVNAEAQRRIYADMPAYKQDNNQVYMLRLLRIPEVDWTPEQQEKATRIDVEEDWIDSMRLRSDELIIDTAANFMDDAEWPPFPPLTV